MIEALPDCYTTKEQAILKKIQNGTRKYKRSIRSFEDFCKDHSRLVIYGAGSIAYKYAVYFEKNNIDYEYFCVTEAEENEPELLQHKVYAYDVVKSKIGDMGIVVAISKAYAAEIIDKLQADGYSDNTFYDEGLTEAVKENFLLSDI